MILLDQVQQIIEQGPQLTLMMEALQKVANRVFSGLVIAGLLVAHGDVDGVPPSAWDGGLRVCRCTRRLDGVGDSVVRSREGSEEIALVLCPNEDHPTDSAAGGQSGRAAERRVLQRHRRGIGVDFDSGDLAGGR
jgi:hypothetical protein